MDTIGRNKLFVLSIHLSDSRGKEDREIESSKARKILLKMAREMKRQGYKEVYWIHRMNFGSCVVDFMI